MNKNRLKVKSSIVFVMLLSLSLGLRAQEKRYDKIKALKVGFITEQLQLTADQAEVFWPIYNEADNSRRQIRRELSQVYSEIRSSQNEGELSEEKSKMLWKSIQKLKSKEQAQNESYQETISQEFGFKMLTQLLVAERDFNARLVRRMGNQRNKSDSKKKRP